MIGASQYTTQVSGSTIYVSPLDALPLRNVPVIAPAFPLDAEEIDAAAVAEAIRTCSSASISALPTRRSPCSCPGAARRPSSASTHSAGAWSTGSRRSSPRGHPLVLAGDGDVGGLMGIHLREEMRLDNAIVSVDGLELKEFDYIDIGAMLPSSGAVPVVIKSLIFPASTAPGMRMARSAGLGPAARVSCILDRSPRPKRRH